MGKGGTLIVNGIEEEEPEKAKKELYRNKEGKFKSDPSQKKAKAAAAKCTPYDYR